MSVPIDIAMSVYNVFAEYVWIDAYNNLRSKNRALTFTTHIDIDSLVFLNRIPKWNYDGSSTGQATTSDSEIVLNPVKLFKDPFHEPRKSKEFYVIVLCDTYNSDGTVCASNTRYEANRIFEECADEKPWFGLEQEFFIININSGRPLGFPEDDPTKWPKPQGPYYCSVGAQNAYGRSLVEDAYRKAYDAGIKVSGMNAEVAPGQWEIQVGPVEGIDAADQLMVLRYILGRVSEEYSERTGTRVRIDFGSKPVRDHDDSWNGSGMHTNFSTAEMRGNYNVIVDAIKKLSQRHAEHMSVYGTDNLLRLTGKNETSSINEFTSSVGGRGTSIRIPNDVLKQNYGYFEDRRPSSSADPYLVTSKLVETCCLNK